MKISNSTAAMNIKLALVSIGALIAIGTLFYTRDLVDKLQERERKTVQLYARSIEFTANSESFNSDVTFIFQNIIQRIDFPLILTNESNPENDSVIIVANKNIDIDSTLSDPVKKILLHKELIKLSQTHKAIQIKAPNGKVLQQVYYGDSSIIVQLRYYPYYQIGFAILFILIAYSSFSYIKRSEQGNIWVGMSKETAHQLGTPISSLMGWNEILKMNYNNPDKVLDTSEEISSDLNRLNKITKRFSKIGSKPELKKESPFEIIQRVANYFQRRLPQLGKNVSISVEGNKETTTDLNAELFEWVIENLIKNALDAIENKEGKIRFVITSNKRKIEIDAIDNGKGIEYKNRKDIFRPGFSTKRRGWGLGLSLSKRIIENYHSGRIFVKDSVINSGTTFKIVIPIKENVS
jgi:nitrogen-specific signal transduction histidine kinase